MRESTRWHDSIVSVDGSLMLHRTAPMNQGPGNIRVFGAEYKCSSRDVSSVAGFEVDEHGKRPPFDAFDGSDHVLWRWDWAGFTFGAALKKPLLVRRIDLCLIPYWSLVLPLTAISAWLLLSKPKTSNQKRTPEPTANGGGAS